MNVKKKKNIELTQSEILINLKIDTKMTNFI
jgi:hypothetical protein